jgi:thioredoxin 1
LALEANTTGSALTSRPGKLTGRGPWPEATPAGGLTPRSDCFKFAAMSNVAAVTDAEFKQKVLSAKNPVLVDFWAVWCGPCRAIAPIVEELAQEYAGKVDFYKLNVDDNAEATTNYRVRGIPTLLLFKKGEVVDQVVGAVPKSNLQTMLQKHL